MSRVAGQGVILTGASGGIGQALVAELLARGAHVLAVGRDPQRLNRLLAQHPGRPLSTLGADLTQAADRDALCARAQCLRPLPGVLIHAAAISEFGLFEQADAEQLGRIVGTNLIAPMLLTRQLLPQLARRPGAAVVAIGSTFGSIGYPGFAAYSASKFGLRGLIEALAREHADGPVRFQWIAPRATRTAFNSAAADALNRALKVASDAPETVAAWIVRAIEAGRPRQQYGWPEKLFARLNGALPALVDRALGQHLPTIRHFARDDRVIPQGE